MRYRLFERCAIPKLETRYTAEVYAHVDQLSAIPSERASNQLDMKLKW